MTERGYYARESNIVVCFKNKSARDRWVQAAASRNEVTTDELKQHGWTYPFYDTVTKTTMPSGVNPAEVYWAAIL